MSDVCSFHVDPSLALHVGVCVCVCIFYTSTEWTDFPWVPDPWAILTHILRVWETMCREKTQGRHQTHLFWILNYDFLSSIFWLHCYTKDRVTSGLRSLLRLLWDQWHFLGLRILCPSNSQLDFDNIVEQGAKTRRICERAPRVALPIPLATGTSRWLPAGAHRGGQHPSFLGRSEEDPEGATNRSCCLWHTWSWYAHAEVDPNENMLLAEPRPLGKETMFRRRGHDSSRAHLTWFGPPRDIRFLRKYSRV